MTTFVAAREIQRIAGSLAQAVLPDEDADTLPVPIRRDEGVVLLVMFYRVGGPPEQRVVAPPHFAMHLDGVTGQVLRFFACTPEELGIVPPLSPVPGAGADRAMDGLALFEADERLLDLSPTLWGAFADGTAIDAPLAEAAKTYRETFLAVTDAQVAHFYLAAAPDFFAWLEQAAREAP